jgi:RNase P subunit RPR2
VPILCTTRSRTECWTPWKVPVEWRRRTRCSHKAAGREILEGAEMIYRGFWIICRNCLFPVRLPYQRPGISVRNFPDQKRSIVLACPACGHVRRYRPADFKRVDFRMPDPFLMKKAVLYAVNVGCASPHCTNNARIYAVAARTVSVASLLAIWKYWVIHVRCQGHPFKPLSRRTWGIYSISRQR